MKLQIWSALLAFTLLFGSASRTVAQADASKAAGDEQAKAAILAARYAHGLRKTPPLLPQAGSPAEQPYEDQAASKVEFVIFDAPGAVQGTFALDINAAGDVTGFYFDANNVTHSFLRVSEGAFTTFDVPGAVSTQASSINTEGEITGFYSDVNNISHGFVRTYRGAFMTFDLPAGSFVFIPATPSINPRGKVTGYYADASSVPHGFLRTPDGTFKSFDVPGASSTFANSINLAGEVAGYYDIVTNEPSFSIAFHGFVRGEHGTITTFDVPGALDTFATSNSINATGTIAGNYYDSSMESHAYLRSRDGTYTSFDVPGAGNGAFQGTGIFGVSINAADAIAGTYSDANNTVHGFRRDHSGATTTFDPSGSIGTFANCINEKETIAGYYLDANNTSHGFLLKEKTHQERDKQ